MAKLTLPKLTLQRTPQRPGVMIAASMALSALVTIGLTDPASSAPLHPTTSVPEQAKDTSDIVQVRAVARRGGVAVGPRGGGVAYRSRTVVRGPAVRPGGAARCPPRCMGAACHVSLAARRRDRGRRSDWRCNGRNGRRLGGRSTGAGHVLVLHRSLPHTGILGLLPIGRRPGVRGESRDVAGRCPIGAAPTGREQDR